MPVERNLDDLGELLHTERHLRRWRASALPAVAILALVLVVSRDAAFVAAATAGVVVVATLSAHVRFEVLEHGVVIRGFFVTRRYHWSQITAFSPMPRSAGRPGRTGAVVVDGVNHEILSLREPRLYAKLRHLNAALLAYRRREGIATPPPAATDRPRAFSRKRQPLWLGPGAAWWPAEGADRDGR